MQNNKELERRNSLKKLAQYLLRDDISDEEEKVARDLVVLLTLISLENSRNGKFRKKE